MKTYRIVITDPNVQSWFNTLFDQAELSRTIECMARDRLDEAKITVELEPIFGKEAHCFLSKIKKWIQNPLD
ncbi:MAG: hypothetical protein QCH96_07045 [Candidatus Thermoplasmatota archaeon]|nr:hypothetical protein [Candidatus Thermoplasmatota archaeon]